MTRIEKSSDVPEVLQAQGVAACNRLKADFAADPEAFTSRLGKPDKEVRKFYFKRELYAHPNVVSQLRADQHHKCCFCEASFLDVRSGDVEHYRPKAAIIYNANEKWSYPGYYWLAYEWHNLLLSCADCNQKYKRNHFELADEKDRVKDHLQAMAIAKERPLLVDPLQEDPAAFIHFVKGEAVAIDQNERGKYTIDTLKLNRMIAAREQYLLEVRKNLLLCQIDENDPEHLACASFLFGGFPSQEIKLLVQESKKFIARAATPKGKFSLCIRCNFPDLPTQ